MNSNARGLLGGAILLAGALACQGQATWSAPEFRWGTSGGAGSTTEPGTTTDPTSTTTGEADESLCEKALRELEEEAGSSSGGWSTSSSSGGSTGSSGSDSTSSSSSGSTGGDEDPIVPIDLGELAFDPPGSAITLWNASSVKVTFLLIYDYRVEMKGMECKEYTLDVGGRQHIGIQGDFARDYRPFKVELGKPEALDPQNTAERQNAKVKYTYVSDPEPKAIKNAKVRHKMWYVTDRR